MTQPRKGESVNKDLTLNATAEVLRLNALLAIDTAQRALLAGDPEEDAFHYLVKAEDLLDQRDQLLESEETK